MSRRIWKMALGFTEKRVEDDGAEIMIIHGPDRGMMNLLLDRIEGKVVPATDIGKKRSITVADKVGEQGAKRIEQASGLNDG